MTARWIALFLGLAACTTSSPAPQLPASPDSCGAKSYQDLVGSDATALEKVLILGQVRLIRPNTAVTQDYREQRINFHIAQDNRIERVSCG